MLSRLLHIGVGRRLERAALKIGELETLQSRLAEIQTALEARAAAEVAVLRRLTDYHIRFELTRQQLAKMTAQVSEDERSLQRERDRADSAEARAAASIEALAASEARLAEVTSGRAKLHAKLEQEHALRVIAEQEVRTQQMREAQLEKGLLRLAEAFEVTVSTLSKRLAARRASYEKLGSSVKYLAGRMNLLLESVAVIHQAAVTASPAREDQHLRFYATGSGYELTVAEGPPPPANTVVDGSGLVVKLGRSPLPADDRCCAYLLPCTDAGAQPHDGLRAVGPA